MNKLFLILGVAFLMACGGGNGEAGGALVSAAFAGNVLQKNPKGNLPASLPGDPETRSVGETSNGGHVVAWVSEFDVLVQRYNKAGRPVGETIRLPIPYDLPDFMSPPAVVVQANGEIAVAYQRVSAPAVVDPAMPLQKEIGVYLQRFAANGAPLGGELEVVSLLRYVTGARQELRDLRALALSDGSFVVSWGVRFGGCLGCDQVDLFMQRFDPSGAPVSDILVPVQNYFCANRQLNSTFEWDADETGGFSVHGTIYPRQFDGEDPCGGFGPPVERQVFTYYPGAGAPEQASKQEKRKSCVANAKGLKGQERKALINSCLAS